MDYDDAGRLSSLTHGASEISSGENWDGTSTLPASLGSSDLLAAYTFDYDADNRLTQFSTYRDGTSTAYGYDLRDQLTSAASTAISGLSQPFGLASAESYDFDAGGNRKSSGGASQSAANTHNQLQTDGTYNYTYDDEGNTLSRTVISTGAVTLYEWDHRNRLESITEKTSAVGSVTQKIEYIYDALDQRVGKRLDSDGDGDFDRDEVFLWTEGQTVLRATDSDGETATETFTLASRYLYGDMVDQLLADEQYNGGTGPDVSATTASATAGDSYWALTDHLGSVRDLVDNSGVIRQHVAYDSFGNRIVEQDYDASGSTISSSHADAIDELFGYTGRDWDADAQLQNNRARWYDPATGRWLSNDPIGFAAGDANLYRYVGNQTTTLTDPSGLEPPSLDDATIPERGVIGTIILGGTLGLAESGRAISYPLRWFGVDFTAQDLARESLWAQLRAPEGTQFQTQCSANVAAFAVHSVVINGATVRIFKYVRGATTAGSVGGAAGTTAGASATEGRILMQNGQSLIGWVRNGEIVGLSAPNTSHAALGTQLGVVCEGAAVKGAQAVTVIKEGGKITVLGSANFGGVLNVSDEAIKVITTIIH
ncbi:RHS repeat-associated core domain-containing protein [Allorhodopirellula solitaria]|uniref:Putative deoxyribonuclease RhsB n=1 Tax=Allorhodopirellula solitaria TaxID=2527987 RepID=A0A5C5XSG4_9BACT|nr:RHS repeat-associated core domain-containing protein [Allorhodopirellula solitaria]TWT66157.1 putative deoxyribonuclease RhsB [Allorhodopirellula solitaria]